MGGCVASCAAARPQAGDHIILKGGVTWPNAVFPIIWNWSGASGNPIYIGVNQTWYAGGSWARPVFDAGGTQIAGTFNGFIKIQNTNYVTIDQIEMKGLYWTGNPAYGTLNYINAYGSTYLSLTNDYFHGWSHDTYANGTRDALDVVLGMSGAPFNQGSVVDHCIFDGSPNGTDSAGAVYAWPTVTNSVARNMANGFLTNGLVSTVSGSTVGPINQSFDSSMHENCIEPVGDTGTVFVFNNVIHDCTAVSFLSGPSNSPTAPLATYFFNNVLWSSGSSAPIPIQIDQRSPSSDISAYVYNNTAYSPNNNTCIRLLNRGSGANNVIDIRNNFCITGGSAIDLGPGATTLTNANNVTMTAAQATTAGMSLSEAFPYEPLSSNCGGAANCPVGQGQNLSGLANGNLAALANDTPFGCTVDASYQVACPARAMNVRGQTWAAGAYQVGSTSSQVPNPPTGLVATVN
jgi:hypothetical protein